MNFKNWAENLLIILVSVSVGGGVGFFAAKSAYNDAVAQLQPTIEKAIDKETIKNEIKNEIKIDKIKKSDSLIIKMHPINNQKPVNVISTDCIPISELSPRELRRLKRNN